jgi:predicted RNA binding protein YcfA (HicA-like mRNA interferase family)
MPKLPVLKPQEVVSRLEALGFVETRQRGSHKQFRHPDGRGTTVPFHNGRDEFTECVVGESKFNPSLWSPEREPKS